jgi:hypothetical protein
MVLVVPPLHYRNLIFNILTSAQLFGNEFITAYLYVADRILLFFCDVELRLYDFWVFRWRLLLLLLNVPKKSYHRFLLIRRKFVPNGMLGKISLVYSFLNNKLLGLL